MPTLVIEVTDAEARILAGKADSYEWPEVFGRLWREAMDQIDALPANCPALRDGGPHVRNPTFPDRCARCGGGMNGR